MKHHGQMISYHDYLRSLSRRKRQRREREAITQEIVLRFVIFMSKFLLYFYIDFRALKIDQKHRRSRRHQFEIAARRIVNNNFEVKQRNI
jgi:hypothetical protein